MEKALVDKALFDEALDITIPNMTTSFGDLVPSRLTVVTMTVVCRTNLGRMNLDSLRQYITENPQGIDEGIHISSKTMGNNAVIFKWKQDTRNIAAKIFATGSMHITGVKNPAEAVFISDFFCRKLTDIDDGKVEAITDSYEVCMINSYFSIPERINLVAAREACEKDDIQCVLNLDKHPGLQCKVKPSSETKHSTSIFFFSTGKIIITGARSSIDLVVGYRRACMMLSSYSVDVLLPPAPKKEKGKRGRKKKIVTEKFYNDLTI